MADLFASGRAADAVIALLVVETLALAGFAWRSRSREAVPQIAAAAAAGIGLLFALRAALVGAEWTWIALPLMFAGAAHAIELMLRLRHRPQKVQ